ncbi:MAG: ERF family protein [Geminicoccales bacterium]
MPIYQKIQQVMQAVKGVEKSEKNKHAGYKFAGHEAVTAALREKFAELGIVRHASATSCEVLDGGAVKLMVRITYVDVEDSSKIEIDMPAIQPPQGKPSAQQVGQALSYAVKNCEFKLFALTGDTEADSDAGPPPGFYDEPQGADNWNHGGQTKARPAGSRQASAHGAAATTGEVTVRFMNGEVDTAPSALEAAKMLAERLKHTDSWFYATQMLGSNDEWIKGLPGKLSERLNQIVDSKQEAAKEMGEKLGGVAA